MKIAVIGTGNVGGTLGTRFAQAGHEVTFGTRTPDSADVKQLIGKAGRSARAATVAQAAAAADFVLLATPWQAAQDVIREAGGLAGKVVIDAMNPLKSDLKGLELGTTTSAAEQVAQWAPQAKVVKAFNTVGFNVMANPVFGADRAIMFYCGDDAAAKKSVHQLAADLGFSPADAGPLTQARLLEPFAMLWISLALTQGYGRDFAFRLLRAEAATGRGTPA